MSDAIRGLDAQQAVNLLTMAKINQVDQEAILSRAGLATATNTATNATAANTAATNANTVAQNGNFKVLNFLKVTWVKFTTFLKANPWVPILVAVTAAIVGITKALKAQSEAQEKAQEKTLEAINTYEDIISEIDTLETKLEELNAQINELNPLTDERDIENLKLETAELEAQLAILQEKEKLAKKEANDAAVDSLNTKTNSKYAMDFSKQGTTMISDGSNTYNLATPMEVPVARKVTEYEELKLAMEAHNKYREQILSLQEDINALGISDSEYSEKANEIETLSKKMDEARVHANELAQSIQEQAEGLTYDTPESTELKNYINTILTDYANFTKQDFIEKYNDAIDYAKTIDYRKNLEDEYQKIQDWGLGGEYEEQIKNGTIQSIFGNVDMDKRTIITWSEELKQTYQDALSSWNYNPEIGSIDTVFGGSDRFGEDLNEIGWEIAFTPILPDGTFLNKDTVYTYIETILAEAYANDSAITEDELVKIDAQGKQIGDTFVKGIFAGIDDSQKYANNGNWAETVGRLMHFSGDFGAVEMAKKAIEDAKKMQSDFDWESWFEENEIDTEEEIDRWNEIARAAENAAEARKKYAKSDIADEPLSFSEVISEVQTLSSGFDQLDAIYADVLNKEDFDYSAILNNDDFKASFSAYEEEYENFIETITNSPKDLSACQSAFNDLATAYIYGQDALKNVMEESKNAVVTMLRQMGVENALEVVESQLAINTANLASAQANLAEVKETLTDTSIDLENATAVEILTLCQEAEQAGLNVDAIYNYAMQKMQANQITITTDGDIQNLADLCGSLGIAGQAIEKFNQIKAKLSKAASFTSSITTTNTSSPESKKSVLGQNVSLFDNGVGVKTDMLDDYSKELASLEAEMKQLLIDFSKGNFKKASVSYTGGNATNSARDQLSKNSGSGSGSDQEDSIETLDWIETKLSRIQRIITNLGKTVSATWRTWSIRNSALASEMDEIYNEINLQQQAYVRYMKQANAVGLSSSYQTLVQNGAIDIQTIQNDDLKEKLDSYTSWYEKALECSDVILDLKDNLADLAKQKFDNVVAEFEDKMSIIEHEATMIEGFLDQTEAKGYLAGFEYYEQLTNLEKNNIALLEQEYAGLRNSLQESIDKGTVEIYSESWYEMTGQIFEVQEAIQEANSSLIEYNNNLRELDWEIFDKTQEYISKIQEESEFITRLMENETLFDEDTGNWTEYADAVAGLHAVNYNAYMSQASDYASQIQEINKELAEDPYNTLLIERRQELLGLQQDMITNAESEKQSIIDLISEGYDVMLNALQEIIDKRKEELNLQKDIYDYENSISEKTKAVVSYQKQLQAISGDDSEEAVSKRQQLTTSLEQAEKDLEETEYDKWLTDQQQMLDSIIDETESWINERLDQIDLLISEVIDNTNANAGTISETIERTTGEVGYTLTEEMRNIWLGESGLNKVVTVYGDNFNLMLTTTNTTLTSIRDLIQTMVNKSNEEAKEDVAEAKKETASVPGMPSSGTGSSAGNSSSTSSTSNKTDMTTSSSSSSSSKWGSWFVSKKDSYPKEKLNIQTSILDRLKFFDINSAMNYRKKYYESMGLGSASNYRGTSSQNKAMLNLMKANGYKKGSNRIPRKELAWTQEDGQELIYRSSDGAMLMPLNPGDAVFTSEMTQRLWNMAKTPTMPNLVTTTLPRGLMSNGGNSTISNDIQMSITLPNVTNYDEFVSEMQKDSRVEKLIQNIAFNKALGKNSLNKYKY